MQPSRYGPFAYSAIIDRPAIRWPGGARIALWVIPNIEFFPLNEAVPGGSGGPVPDVPAWAMRDYGNRVGVFRIMKVLDRYGIRATVALNSEICRWHPRIVEEAMRRNWEIMGHCKTNTQRLNAVDPTEEAALIGDTLRTIAAATGVRPTGWLGAGLQETWNTLELLEAEGIRYVADWVNDDQPYVIPLSEQRRLISVPYSFDINDKSALEKHGHTADEFGRMIRQQFDTLYEEGEESGRVMAICLHPYLTGMPYRIAALDEALAYICGFDGVWLATGDEIARHALATASPGV